MQVKFNWSPEENYDYTLEYGKDLTDFHAEHQASIVADYDRVLNGGRAYGLRNGYEIGDGKKLPRNEVEALYKSTLKNFLKDPSYPRIDCGHSF